VTLGAEPRQRKEYLYLVKEHRTSVLKLSDREK
jgi:hypothetical protein